MNIFPDDAIGNIVHLWNAPIQIGELYVSAHVHLSADMFFICVLADTHLLFLVLFPALMLMNVEIASTFSVYPFSVENSNVVYFH